MLVNKLLQLINRLSVYIFFQESGNDLCRRQLGADVFELFDEKLGRIHFGIHIGSIEDFSEPHLRC